MDRAPDYGSGGWGFDSLAACHLILRTEPPMKIRGRWSLAVDRVSAFGLDRFEFVIEEAITSLWVRVAFLVEGIGGSLDC